MNETYSIRTYLHNDTHTRTYIHNDTHTRTYIYNEPMKGYVNMYRSLLDTYTSLLCDVLVSFDLYNEPHSHFRTRSTETYKRNVFYTSKYIHTLTRTHAHTHITSRILTFGHKQIRRHV